MNKVEVVHKITDQLRTELAQIQRAARTAHEEAIHEESLPEDSTDTRMIEASYIAGAQAQRASELQKLIKQYEQMKIRQFTSQDSVSPTALIELDQSGKRSFYFLAPGRGGFQIQVEGKPVFVIASNSPLGQELVGRRVGSQIDIETRDSVRHYKVISIE